MIKSAHELGCYVITVDYLPDNVAHKYSDEYQYASTTDKEAVLEIAKKCHIDGILTFTDSGVVTAGYVAHELGLPSPGPYESIQILQNKGRFRQFLAEHGFNVPKAKSYTAIDVALGEKEDWTYPVIVKPVDSAGSKGVTKVESKDQLEDAVVFALEYSISSEFIIEEWIEKVGCSSDSDCFSLNGQFQMLTYSAQRFDEKAANPYAPAAFSWPSTMGKQVEEELSSELQRLITLLGMQTSIYNIETRLGTDSKPYIMEVSPRGGGNRLAEVVRYATGVDMITNAVRGALGMPIEEIGSWEYSGHWAEIMLHSYSNGAFQSLDINEDVRPYVRDLSLWVKEGDMIHKFESARYAIGSLILCFPDEQMMLDRLAHQGDWLKIYLDNTYNMLKISKLDKFSGGGKSLLIAPRLLKAA